MKTFLMLHGINHNMFGKRDPKQYGTTTLEEIDGELQELAKELGVKVVSFQTNSEGDMCDRIHQAYNHAREEFRHKSVFAEIILGQISGFGVDSYLLALRAAVSASGSSK